MIKTYILRADEIQNIPLSDYRAEKIRTLKNPAAKILSAAAGEVLDRALSEYGLRECDMSYILNSHGKPYFRNAPEIFFSLSHTDGYAACCIGDTECGIDIQRVKRADMRLAERFFHERECAYLRPFEGSDGFCEAFFRVWAAKESVVKAAGVGIGGNFKRFFAIPESGFAMLNGESYAFHLRSLDSCIISTCFLVKTHIK